MRVPPTIRITSDEASKLTEWTRGRSTPARLVQRALVVPRAKEGMQSDVIAMEPGCTRRTVGTWGRRFADSRIRGLLQDAPRGGMPPVERAIMEIVIVSKTTREKPSNATQWSVRSVAGAVSASHSTVQRACRDNGPKPHLARTFKVWNDPMFAEKLVDVVGLYLHQGTQ